MTKRGSRGPRGLDALPPLPGCLPLPVESYDRDAVLTAAEVSSLRCFVEHRFGQAGTFRPINGRPPAHSAKLDRLTIPLQAVLGSWILVAEPTPHSRLIAEDATAVVLAEVARRRELYWAWPAAVWLDLVAPSDAAFKARWGRRRLPCRQRLAALAYAVGGVREIVWCRDLARPLVFSHVFGTQALQHATTRVEDVLHGWGYVGQRQHSEFANALATVLLLAGSPRLEDLTLAHLAAARRLAPSVPLRTQCLKLSRALAHIGMLPESLPLHPEGHPFLQADPMYRAGVPAEWLACAERWRELTPKRLTTKRMEFSCVLAAGRWLTHTHPEVTSPGQWTRTLAAEYVAAVDKATVGGWSANPKKVTTGTFGKPFKPRSKAGYLAALRGFFCDLQEWGLAQLQFDPRRAFSVPQPIQQLVGPDPRIIDETFWAKLLQAGLSLTDEDVRSSGHNYPAAMVRAVAIVWLFCGMRRDEVRRLRVGCVRRQTRDARVPASDEVLPKGTVVFLDVPPNKTTSTYTKPVDPVVADVIEAWECVRPGQPAMLDAKVGAMVHYLFANRGRMVGMAFLNATLIPLLCRKAGIPEADARGKLTSHRARSTIASMLGNAKEPMTLLELQQWLGHRWPASTQHYFQILPTKLGRAYADADYFRRNVRTVDVLIDEHAITSGAAAQGAPWKYFDLGHGLCANPFYEQCPHRLACARCPFYRPKPSTLEANAEAVAHLQQMTRMQQSLTLTEDELAALTEGADVLQALVDRLKDVPTPGGPTPRQLQDDVP